MTEELGHTGAVPSAGTAEHMSSRERMVLLITLTLANSLGAYAVSATNVALPSIQMTFGASAAALSWVPLAYAVSTAVFLLPMGRIADMRGRITSFMWALRVFALLMLAAGFAPSMAWLIGLRAALGVSSALIIPASTALLVLAYPPEERGKALGLFVAGPYLGLTLGPVFGGVVTQHLGWRTVFWLAGALAIINCLFPIWRLRITERRARAGSFDSIGSVLYAVAMAIFLLGLTSIPKTWGALLTGAGVIGLALFVAWEKRAKMPLLRLDMFRDRSYAAYNLAAFANYAATLPTTFLVSLYLQYTRGLSAQWTGFILVASALVQAVFSPAAGRLSDRIQPGRVTVLGMILCTLGLLGLAFIGETTPYWFLIGVLGVVGLGFAFFAAPVTHAIMLRVEKTQLGVASSTLATLRWAGHNIGLATASLVLVLFVGRQELVQSLYPHVLTSVRVSFGVLTLVCALGVVILALGLRRRPSKGALAGET